MANINRHIVAFGFALLTFAGFAGAAQAVPFTSAVEPDSSIFIDTGNPYSYTHVIDEFDPLIDVIDSANLTIWLSDNGGPESIVFDLEGSLFFQNNTGNASQGYSFDLGALSILTLLDDGILQIELSASSGGYFFDRSELTGTFTRSQGGSTQVPEPATLALLGVGLLGLGLSRRRRA